MKNSFEIPSKLSKDNNHVYKSVHARFRKYRGRTVAQVKEQEFDLVDFANGSVSLDILPTGLIFIPSCLSPEIQNYLNYASVSQYCQSPPHVTNLTSSKEGNTNLWLQWKDSTPDKRNDGRQPAALLNKKLTWSTVGYAYDWTQRCYRQSLYAPMPHILHELAGTVSRDFYSQELTTQAGIVNYYHINSNGMGGHIDDAELTFDKPVVSISLGLCPGIFLLQTSKDKVLPLLMRPGDVVIFFGPLRLAMHGMPCVLQPEDQTMYVEYKYKTFLDLGIVSDVEKLKIPEEDKTFLQSYVSTLRININLRQVLPPGVEKIPSN